jgi:tetratricopeptide (TPR) repeat protein
VNRKQKRLQEKLAKKKGANPQASDEGELLRTAGACFNSGQFRQAAKALEKVLRINPKNFDATNALAIAYANLGKADEALTLFEKTTLLRPDDAVAHYNFARSLEDQGKINRAIEFYRRSVELDPRNAAGFINLGNLIHEMGDPSAADCFRRAIDIDASMPEAHFNLGNLLKDQGKFDESVESFNKALAINPNFLEVIINRAGSLAKSGKLEEAATGYQKALSLQPDDASQHYNLATLWQKLGQLDQALGGFESAISLIPTYAKAWNNYKYALKAHHFLQGSNEGIEEGFSPAVLASSEFAVTSHYLDSFRPHEAGDSFQKAVEALPAKADEEISGAGSATASQDLPENTVALLHFGRSGSGLMHSLIDSHPEISTLPAVYLRGYFNAGVWSEITAEGWRRLPERFVDLYAVLFDANSPQPVPSRLGEETSHLGREEGMTVVGENRDEALSLDKEAFCAAAHLLMKGYEKIDPASFFKVIHGAYEKVLDTKTQKKTIFYHIHNPDEYATLNFQRYMPEARLLMMIREPIESCESWIRTFFENNDYGKIVHRIITMLFGFDRVPFQKHETLGLRLEDLQQRPEATMKALCAWLGVEESPSLYRMTAQGKKWWGDPTSPNYQKDAQMTPFGGTSNRGNTARIFSEQDRLILQTLFYPFSVRFKYQQPDPKMFKENLNKIRPLLEETMDFEKALMEKANIATEQFTANADYALLRASLIDRWNVLNALGDYPNMITPLDVI